MKRALQITGVTAGILVIVPSAGITTGAWYSAGRNVDGSYGTLGEQFADFPHQFGLTVDRAIDDVGPAFRTYPDSAEKKTMLTSARIRQILGIWMSN